MDIWNATNFLLEDPNGSRTKERGTQLWNHNGRKSVYPLELACTFIYMGSEKCSPNNNFFFQLQLTVNLIYYLSNTKNIEVNVADKHFFLEIQYNKFKNPELTLSQMITHGSWTLMTFLSKSGTSLNVVNISWAMSSSIIYKLRHSLLMIVKLSKVICNFSFPMPTLLSTGSVKYLFFWKILKKNY